MNFERPPVGASLTDSQQTIIAIVNDWVGSSLLEHGDELRAFISRGIDDPQGELNDHISDSALFALAVWHAAGVEHKLVIKPYVVGMAATWLVHIAHDLQAIRYPKRDGLPKPGALMQYYSPRPSTNDHFEFDLTQPDFKHGIAQHAGGGRPHCGIAAGESDVHWSGARPLQCWFDPDALLP
jgi:hypothetical protein